MNNPDIYNGCCYAFTADVLPINLYDEYITWIYNIRDSGNMKFQDSDYRKWLNYFQQYDKNYTSPMSDDLSIPRALRNLINNAHVFNINN